MSQRRHEVAKGFSRQELLNLARAGAEARIAQLEAEIAKIRATFGSVANGRARHEGPTAVAKLRKRRMSAAGRKRIADAARRRWANWRAEKKGK
jgi:hypothetical protein